MGDIFYYTSTPFLNIGSFAAYGKLSEMLTPDCYTYFTTKSNFEDADGNRVTPTGRGFMQDLHRALESNNLTVGWTPKHRVAFYHSSYDTVVPFVNLCSFVKNQPYLYYYIQPETDYIITETSSYRLSQAGAYPLWPVGSPDKADVYINDTNSSDDHVGAGKDFFMLGKVLGTSPDYVLQYLLSKHDMSLDDVNVEYKSEGTEVIAALTADPEGIGLLPQPAVTAAVSKLEGFSVVLDLTEEWGKVSDTDLLTGVTVVRTAFLNEHPEAVAAFLNAHADSVAFVDTDLAAAAQLTEHFGIMEKAAVAEKAIPACNIAFITGEDMKAMVSDYLEALYELAPSSVGGALPADDFYYLG